MNPKPILAVMVPLLILLPSLSSAASITICDSGCDNTTIAAALSSIKTGVENTITVQGTYTANEDNIAVSKSGANNSARLSIVASGTQSVKRFYITGSHITLRGFTVTGHTLSYDGLIDIGAAASDIQILNCSIKDAAADVYGIVMKHGGTAPSDSATNVTIQGCTFDYANGGNYPLHMVNLRGRNHIVTQNTFQNNRGADALRVQGSWHIISMNTFTGISQYPGNGNHADIIQTFGNDYEETYNVVFERNFVNGGAEVQIGQITMDNGIAGTITTDPLSDLNGILTDSTKSWMPDGLIGRVCTIKNNIAAGKYYLISDNNETTLTLKDMEGNAVNLYSDGIRSGDAYGIYLRIGWFTFRNNIFINMGSYDGGDYHNVAPYMKWYNNVFYNDSVGGLKHQGHPLAFSTYAVTGRADNCEVKNNIFLKSGADPSDATKGWYEMNRQEPGLYENNFMASNNYVAGIGYAAKSGFSETGGVNGGNPNLSNEGGMTAEDYALTANSKILKDAGLTIGSFSNDYKNNPRPQGPAWDIGAYEYALSGCIHKSDIPPCDGCVSESELMAFLNRWYISNVDVTMGELMEAIGWWKRGC